MGYKLGHILLIYDILSLDSFLIGPAVRRLLDPFAAIWEFVIWRADGHALREDGYGDDEEEEGGEALHCSIRHAVQLGKLGAVRVEC